MTKSAAAFSLAVSHGDPDLEIREHDRQCHRVDRLELFQRKHGRFRSPFATIRLSERIMYRSSIKPASTVQTTIRPVMRRLRCLPTFLPRMTASGTRSPESIRRFKTLKFPGTRSKAQLAPGSM